MKHTQTTIAIAGLAMLASMPIHADELVTPFIEVEAPKVYNDFALRNRLDQIKRRLAAISAVDQTQLTSRVGTIQGGTFSQTNATLQATGSPIPGTTNKTTSQTAGGTTETTSTNEVGSQTGGTSPTASTKNTTQTVVKVPTEGATQEVQIQTAAVTPSVPALGSPTTMAAPSQFSQNPLNVLAEQVQLEMELLTLQTLLEPPISSEYSADGNGRRNVTYGIPITIPTTSNYETRGAAAEVIVTVCPYVKPGDDAASVAWGLDDPQRPMLVTMIPKEKTYNTAAVVNKSFGVGLGTIAGVFNVGGNFSWTRDTYYLVRAQDTVAQASGDSPRGHQCAGGATPLTFGWIYKPVLGQKLVEAGVRESLVQLSIPRASTTDTKFTFHVATRWRKFEAKTGATTHVIGEAKVNKAFSVPTTFDTLKVNHITYSNARSGYGTVRVLGHFLPGTRVRLGSLELSTVENTGGSLEFTVSNQALATGNLILISPDGTIRNLDDQPVYGLTVGETRNNQQVTRLRGAFKNVAVPACGQVVGDDYCLENDRIYTTKSNTAAKGMLTRKKWHGTDTAVANSKGKVAVARADCSIRESHPDDPTNASVRYISPSLAEVSIPLFQCEEVGSEDGDYPLFAVMGGTAYGFPESRFSGRHPGIIRFIAPRSDVDSAGTLEVGRLLLGRYFRSTYLLPKPSQFLVDSVAIGYVSKKEIRYLVFGNDLDKGTLLTPKTTKSPVTHPSNKVMEFSLPVSDDESYKKLVFQGTEDQLIYTFDLPASEKKPKEVEAKADDPKAFKMTLTGTLPK